MSWSVTSKEKKNPDCGCKFLGLSMSKCVNDIILGLVQESDVMAIITATRIPDVETAIKCYWCVWSVYAEQAEMSKDDVQAIVAKLWGRFMQPRFDENNPYIPENNRGVHWMSVPARYYPY